jgi:hypothetical protein
MPVPVPRVHRDQSSGHWRGRQTQRAMGSPPPLPDEAVVLVSVFSDHVELDTVVGPKGENPWNEGVASSSHTECSRDHAF